MKKLFAFISISIALVSCYSDYITDFDYDGIYFANAYDVRTVVVGEGMKIKVGAELGGVRENAKDRNVSFVLDNTLITPALLTTMKASSYAFIKNSALLVGTLKPMPTNYYTLSNNSTIVIKAGQHVGYIDLKVDSALFLADDSTIKSQYIVPFKITAADADTIIEPLRSNKIAIKYENMLFGNYWHGGVATVDSAGVMVKPIPYYTSKSQPETKVWVLTTVKPNQLANFGYSNVTSTTKKEMILTLDGTNITISTATGATNTYLADGASTFNRAKLLQNRKILLNYKYVVGVKTFHCQDTLTFRNRIRDGINEWQDENPLNYLK
jgi:hypothetical protein